MKSIYLDNSATSYPKPEIVKKTVMNAMNLYGANPGRASYKMCMDTTFKIYETRKKIASFFGFPKPENVVFTKSCTESINIVLFSKLKSGDHVVVSDLEHNSVIRPLNELSKIGVTYTVFETFSDNDETLNSLRNSIKPNTKLMVCTCASNVFGIKLPISRLCAMCHFYDIETCVDSAQMAGISTINMQEMMIDYLCVPAHKGLLGLMGSGILLSKDELKPMIYGGTGTSSFDFEMPELLPERLESGTANVCGILSMGAGIDFINQVGIEKIEESEMKKIQYIYDKLSKNKNIILYTDFPEKKSSVAVLSFNVKDKLSEDTGNFLAKNNVCVRAGIHCSPLAHKKMKTKNGTVRISPSYFTTIDEINNSINIINFFAKQ